jgi:thiol-disulfide isomerase/thioredoxin
VEGKQLFLFAIAFAVTTACSKPESEPRKDPSTNETPSSQVPSTPLVLAPKGIRFEHAPKGDDVNAIVKTAREGAAANGRDLVVYVGAKWCEPCQRFHQAAERGELDEQFPNLTVLDFDVDEDRERLLTAGYESKFLPFFVVPDANGRATDKRFEGSVKGNGAVTNITPRLRQILAK